MKLLNCIACQDIVRIFSNSRKCQCGRCKARYVNDRNVEYSGPARIIAIQSLDYHKGDSGVEHPWCFIPRDSEHIRKTSDS